ncbi:MAG: response regulator [Oscillatoriaceae bacterium SKYG93]|nr:response regulator [Oscillatoriaceae bacterium SKYG93]MDW8454474.1 response regulator [Oscillatoriaceae cyanobacterium SKYGB_i_bin93]
MAKILIVDDSNMSRKLMRKILQTEGHEVIEAKDGLTALETYLLEKPDLVLIDLLMPDMQGTEVLAKLRQLDDKAQVIVASADLQDLTRASVEAAGAVGYITKPFVASNVLKIVNSVLQGIKKVL